MYIYILLRWGLGGFSKVYLISKIVPSFIHLSKSESKPLFCGLTPPTNQKIHYNSPLGLLQA